MLIIINQVLQIEFLLLVFTFLLIIFLLVVNYQKVKKVEIKKLAVIYSNLENEKKKATAFLSIPNKISSLEQQTQKKLQLIKVEIVNLDFSIKEIFS